MDKVHIGVISHAHGHINTYCSQMQHYDDVELVATWDDNMYFDDATHAADWFYWIFGHPISVMAEIDNIRGLSDERVSPEEGRVSVEMILGAYQSAKEGRRITF